jgi:hypothetical protein
MRWKSIILSIVVVVVFLTREARKVISATTPDPVIELRRCLRLELESVECGLLGRRCVGLRVGGREGPLAFACP